MRKFVLFGHRGRFFYVANQLFGLQHRRTVPMIQIIMRDFEVKPGAELEIRISNQNQVML